MSWDRSDVLSVIIGKCFRPKVEVRIPLLPLSGFSPFLEPDQDDVVAQNGYNPRDLVDCHNSPPFEGTLSSKPQLSYVLSGSVSVTDVI